MKIKVLLLICFSILGLSGAYSQCTSEKGYDDFPFTEHGITVNASGTGAYISCSDVLTSCGITPKASNVWIGQGNLIATFTNTFSQPINDMVYNIAGANTSEVMTITVNSGTPNITYIAGTCSDAMAISGNVIAVVDNMPGDGTGGRIKVHSTSNFTSITFSHNGYGNGSLITMCFDGVFASIAGPTVSTTAVTAVTTTTATSGGNVTADGGATVTAKGVCWNATGSPTISDAHTNDGTGLGSFASSLTNLSPNTTYYLRAYATNSTNTSYGSQAVFTTDCTNPTFGGTIGSAQTICSGNTPSGLTSFSSPTGHAGTLEYKWQLSTSSATSGFNDIATSNSATYAPGVLSATSWYKRLARGTCKTDWTGVVESNVVKVTVNNLPPIPSAGSNSYTYDGTIKTAVVNVGAGETVDWYAAATGIATASVPSGINVGNYSAYAEVRNTTTGCVSANRTLITLTITKATLTATADAKTKKYGDANPTLTFQYSGWKNGETETVIDTKPTASTTVNLLNNVGTYTNAITISGGLDNNYDFIYGTANFAVTQATLTATAINQTKVYGATNPTLTFAYSGWVNGVEVIDVAPTAATTVTTTSIAGNYLGSITLSGGSDNNYTFNLVAGNFTINKAELTVAAINQTKVYGATNPTLGFTYSGWVNGVEVIDVAPTAITTVTTASSVGNYSGSITLSGGSDNNYTFNYVTGNFTITKAELTVKANDQTKVFGSIIPSLGFTYIGWVNGAETIDVPPTAVTTVTTTSIVGSYPGSITLSGGLDNNYTFSFVAGDFIITAKPITITANAGQSKVYVGVDPVLTYTYAPALIGSDTFTGSLARASGENAGDHAIEIGTLSAGTNYTLNLENQVFNISKLNISGTFTAGNKAYDANNTASITSRSLVGVLNADLGKVSLSGGTATFSDKLFGTGKVVTLSGMSLSGTAALNYNLTGVATTTANITKLDISGTFTASSKTYDGNNTASIAGRSLVGVPASDLGNVSLIGGTATFSNALAGTSKVVTSSGMSLSGTAALNYNLTGVATATANINRAIIIVTAEEKTKVYGEADPVFTYTVAPALIDADLFTGALSRKNGENVGSYAINAGTLNAGTNYTIAFVSLDLSITAKAITVTANLGQTKVYGTNNPVLTYTVAPALVGNDILGGALSRAAGENIGSAYAIGIGTLTNPNYNITYTGDNFSITAKPITVTVNTGQTKVYGDVDPALIYTVSPAMVGNDAFTGVLSRIAGENFGSYAINVGTLDAGTNYILSFAGNDFSITAKPVTVTADAGKTKVYGSADPVFTYTVSETLANGNSFAGALSRATGENVGSYAINPGTLSAGANYKINFVSKDLSITQKALSVNTPTLTTSRTYNGSTLAVVSAGTLSGVVTGDASNVSISAVANYDNRNIGSGKTINVVYALSGSASSNYTKPVNYTVSSGVITAKQLIIGNTIVTDNKMYDGNITAVVTSVGTLSGIETVDANNISITAVASYADAKVGTSKTITVVYTLGGTAVSNYIVPVNLLINTAKISEPIVLNTMLLSTSSGCEGSEFELKYTASSGTPVQYQITFGAAALSAGFQNINFTDLTSSGNSGVVLIHVPSGISFGTYQASFQVRNELGIVSDSYPFQFVVNVSTDFIVTKFDDVVLCDNKTINFISYQWYKNGSAIDGATKQFYNDPLGLVGAYSLKLKTVGGQELQTCPKVLNIPKAKKVSVSVYPNPMRANQVSTVKITGMSDEELQGAVMNVYNIQGIQVYSTKTVEQLNSLTLQNLDGSYVGHIITAKGNDYVYRILLVK